MGAEEQAESAWLSGQTTKAQDDIIDHLRSMFTRFPKLEKALQSGAEANAAFGGSRSIEALRSDFENLKVGTENRNSELQNKIEELQNELEKAIRAKAEAEGKFHSAKQTSEFVSQMLTQFDDIDIGKMDYMERELCAVTLNYARVCSGRIQFRSSQRTASKCSAHLKRIR